MKKKALVFISCPFFMPITLSLLTIYLFLFLKGIEGIEKIEKKGYTLINRKNKRV